MKSFLLSFLMLTMVSGFAFAAETSTECEMMREQNERNNPKANIKASSSKPKSASSTAQ